ncbi:MAG: NUDIX domain-containing protein [Proteobacteria bacterium]|nr:NUDIX domain-containing protein [Pseudomonadota bacterium]
MAKIPPHATRVFKGVIFDIYQWQQQMFNGTTATFEMAKRPATTIVIPVEGGKVYYSRQEQPGKKPFMGLFGGRVEEGEDPLEAAKRELMEEAGMESTDWAELFTHHYTGKIDWPVYYYIARNVRQSGAQQLDGGEKIAVESCPVDEFLSTIATHPDFIEAELKAKLLSSFNSAAAAQIKGQLA